MPKSKSAPHPSPAGQTASWFFAHARDLFGVVSPQGIFLEVNPAWTTLTGWPADELVGRNLLDFLHESSREPVIEMGRQLNRDGDTPARMRLRCKDGRWLWLEGYARRGPDGEMMGMLRDVTDAQHREADLNEAAHVQALLSETAGVGLWRFDPEADRIHWSAEWTRMLEKAGIEMETPADFERVCHPDDFAQVLATMNAAIEGGVAGAFDHRMQASDGGWLSVRAHVRAQPTAEGGYLVHGLSQDVTELVRAREASDQQADRLRIALEAAHAAVVDIDYEHQTVWTSPGFKALVGYALTYDQAARTVWPCVIEEDAARVKATVRALLEGAEPEPLELRLRTASGEARWARVFTELQHDACGRLKRSISLVIDVDDEKRQELALIDAEKAAQAAADSKSQFLANMSHELRTPMNGVLGVLRLLQGQALPVESASLVDEALSCGGMLQALLDDIIDFSRIEAGRLEIAAEPVDPQAVVESVAALARRLADEKNLAFALELDVLPAWIAGDPLRLRQCLFNLIGNAIKFTAEGSVTVRARSLDAAGKLRFEIEDTGVGMAPEVLPQIFDRFRQADASTTRRFGGSGLGLAITRKLAALMGGEVGCTSEVGKGSTFWLEIPIREASAPTPSVEPDLPALDGLKVLVVEDNPTNRMIAQRIMESLGAVVATADDGVEGVEMAVHGGFDLILMDIQMPRLDGVGATRRIRRSVSPSANIPIIGLTANVLAHQRDEYMAAGMDGVVGKPVSPSVLLREILRIAQCEGSVEAASG